MHCTKTTSNIINMSLLQLYAVVGAILMPSASSRNNAAANPVTMATSVSASQGDGSDVDDRVAIVAAVATVAANVLLLTTVPCANTVSEHFHSKYSISTFLRQKRSHGVGPMHF